MGDWYTPIKEPIQAMAIKIWGYVPNVIGAIIILLVGLALAKVITNIIIKALKLSKLDVASEKAGIANMMKVGEIKASLSEIIGVVIYWLLVLLVAATAAQVLKLTAAVDLMSSLIAYIPHIIAAILVLAIGSFLASFVGSLVAASAKNAGLKKANMLAQIVKITLVIFAIGIALDQLGVGTGIVTQAISIILLSIGAGFALAFGLGCKDMVGRWVSDFINSMK